jgi:hypothetical protein
MDRKLAEQIVALVNAHIDQLISSLAPVEQHLSPDEFTAYKRGVSRVISAYDAELMELVTREHPDLAPQDDDPEPAADAPPRARRPN